MESERIYTFDQLDTVADELFSLIKNKAIVTLQGPLGAGKTTMTRELVKRFGIDDSVVCSPTFAYLNIYKRADGFVIYHFDLYRIATEQEFRDLGFDEYLYQPNSVCIVEWPDPLMSLLHGSVVHLQFDYGALPDQRVMIIK